MKEYVRDLSEFMQVVRRTGSVEFGLRSAVRHGGSAKLLLASSGLTQDEVARLEEAARGARGVLVHYAELSPAELGRAAGRQHPVKALAVTALGDADLDRFLESLRDLEASGAVRVIRAARRRER